MLAGEANGTDLPEQRLIVFFCFCAHLKPSVVISPTMPDRRRWACSERLSCKSTVMCYPENRQLVTCVLFEAPLACLAEDDKDAFHVKVGAPGLLRSASPGC